MSKYIYLLGAGASYGSRDEKGAGMAHYSSGMPIMDEIGPCLDAYCAYLSPHISFGDGKRYCSHPHVYDELKWLRGIAKDHPTIDTYAKKLYIHGPFDELERMKRALSIFFTLIQSKAKRDMRYDKFMEEVADERGKLRSDVSILSWNYDHQCEFAFHEYEMTKTSTSHQYMYANISCKGYTSQFIKYDDSNLVKLNGMAWFKPKHDRYLYEEDDNTLDHFERLLSGGSFNADNFVSYAWEEDNDFIEKVLPLTSDTETLVIIGYSLPGVNRKIDSLLINNMKNLKSIVIQDYKCEELKDVVLDILPAEKRQELQGSIRCTRNVASFFVPQSLLV